MRRELTRRVRQRGPARLGDDSRPQVGGTKKPLIVSLIFHPLLVFTYRSW
jgi:hypothetical protein